MDGDMTVGLLVAFQSLMDSFTKPITTFVTFGNALQETGADLNRLDDVLRYENDPAYLEGRAFDPSFDNVIKLSGHVELRNVSFGFNPLGPPLIDNLNFTVKPGQRIALVGGSGSGKSTASKIVAGLFKQWSGEIYSMESQERRSRRDSCTTPSEWLTRRFSCLRARYETT